MPKKLRVYQIPTPVIAARLLLCIHPSFPPWRAPLPDPRFLGRSQKCYEHTTARSNYFYLGAGSPTPFCYLPRVGIVLVAERSTASARHIPRCFLVFKVTHLSLSGFAALGCTPLNCGACATPRADCAPQGLRQIWVLRCLQSAVLLQVYRSELVPGEPRAAGPRAAGATREADVL